MTEEKKEQEQQEQETNHSDADKQHEEHKHEKKGKKIKISHDEYESLQQKAKELEETKDTFLRKIADFENSKKRLERAKDEFAKYANETLIQSFLPVLDTLDHALVHGENTVSTDALISGVNLIRKQMLDVLKNYGLEKIETVGKPFDPHMHEAMGVVHTDEVPADAVVDEVRCGYKLKDKLLRASWVRVAVDKDEASGNDTDTASHQPEGANGTANGN